MLKYLLCTFSVITLISTTTSAQNALNFDGTNDYVQTTYSGVTGTSARTIEAWIKTTANCLPVSSGGSGQKVIVDYGTFLTGSRFTMNLLWANSIRLEVGGSGVSGTLAVNDGLWHHVAAVYNPLATNNILLYIDGVLNASGSLSVNTGTTNNVMIGQRVDGINKFLGEIDEVRIWNVARTASQIQSNMNSEFCVVPTSLKAYYKCNQGTASGTNAGLTTLNDNSGNNYNGTLSGFSLSGNTSNWVTGATLTSGNLTGGTAAVSGCVPYTTLGNQILTTSGMYPDTFLMPSGCDSSYTINFTALASSASNITTTSCDFFVMPSGSMAFSSGVYQDTVANSLGCDSIITFILTINNTSVSSVTNTSCNSFTSPAGNIYTNSGTYVDTFQNAIGCDSLITINLTIINGYYITLNEIGCDLYTSPSGKIWTTSGTYLDTILTGTGCDSLYTINLVMNQNSTGIVTQSACDEYISDNGNTYTASGTYTEVISNASGCDSVITLNITITNIDTSVMITLNTTTLMAVASGLTYRWLDCDENFAPISGGNQQSYTPSETGNYAVKITDGSCVDTSSCVNVIVVGIDDIKAELPLRVYPNPAQHQLYIDNSGKETTIIIYTVSGKEVKTIQTQNGVHEYDISNLNSGLYLIKYSSNNNSFVEKLVVE